LARASGGFKERLFVVYLGGVVMNEPRVLSSQEQRTRRNIMKMGAILGAVALTRVESAIASPVVCPSVISCHCLLRGTNIRTTTGERRIEDLAVGDLLPTVFGGVRPIQWIGRYPIKKSDPSRPWAKEALPIRVARSAFAPDVPHADLYLTGPHALLIDDLLIPIGNLINDTTIRRHDVYGDEFEFFHIKMESHDAIYAEGAPVETLQRVDESQPILPNISGYTASRKLKRHCAPRVFPTAASAVSSSHESGARFRLGLIAASRLT
jgi:Hint domain